MMIWGCFQGLKMGPMAILPKGCQNAQSFINSVYKPVLKPFLQSIQKENQDNIPILMEDGAAVHCSQLAQGWRIMKTTIGRFYQPKNLTELTEAIHKAWSEILLQILKNLVASMPVQMAEVIASKGGHTHY
ncbi:hypothetical protein PPACK8108_LOCUS3235 [Phakopsora pachyrhizi]|uniref:Tc1-like transposase DDE domain-containing protein n=1 Tax=Phakopsora pachyrhizi TaxID=170000 RepID=A0AAV0AK55_PHAPC|nr:hypothetical protein PPACK8108_LOCUS3235 [Phakopsora pachyrhizi]